MHYTLLKSKSQIQTKVRQKKCDIKINEMTQKPRVKQLYIVGRWKETNKTHQCSENQNYHYQQRCKDHFRFVLRMSVAVD